MKRQDRHGAALLYLFGLAFAAEQVGLLAHPANSTLAMVLIAGGALARIRGRWMLGLGAASAAVAGLGLALVPISITARFFPLSIAFFALGRLRTRGDERAELETWLGHTCALFGMFEFLVSASPAAWHVREGLASWLVGLGALRGALDAGPTYSGFDLLVLVGAAAASRWMVGGRAGSAALSFVASSTLLVLFASFVSSWAILANSEGAVGTFAAMTLAWLHPLHYGWLSAPLLLLPLAWLSRQPVEGRTLALRARWLPYAVGSLGIVAPALLYTAPPSAADLGDGPPRVALYEKGFLNWLRPQPDHFGPSSTGMLGMLPRLLATKGIESELISEIDPETLAGFDALVVINQSNPLGDETVGAMDDFVRAGGGLLILGDHTCWRNDQVLINEPLVDRAIRFNFDNAEFFVGGWLHSSRFWTHPVVSGIDDFENNAGIVIGASLDVSYPAVPLVVGQYGFSDPGEIESSDRGYMGNRKHDPGERLGDVVLAALQDVGDGRLAVVGDTTSFTNGVMTTAWPFVSQLVDWLVSDARATVPLARELAALLLCLLFVVGWALVSGQPHGRGANELLVVTLFVSCLTVTWLHDPARWSSLPGSDTPGSSETETVPPVAVIDHSHVTKCSRENIADDGYGGLVRNLMRDDFVVLQTRSFEPDLLRGAELVVISAPGRRFSSRELEVLDDYVCSGGELLLSLGREDREAASALLEHWGLEVGDLPFGRDNARSAISSEFLVTFEAWEVDGAEPLIQFVDSDGRDRSLAVRKSVGEGFVTLIGDGHFLRDKNIETEDGPTRQNVAFLRDYIALIRKDS